MKLGEFSHRYWLGAVIFILASAPLIYLAAHGHYLLAICTRNSLGLRSATSGLCSAFWNFFVQETIRQSRLHFNGRNHPCLVSYKLVIVHNADAFNHRHCPFLPAAQSLFRRRGKNPIQETPKLIFFDWGGTGHFLSANVFYALVYDESDEVALPANPSRAVGSRQLVGVAPRGRHDRRRVCTSRGTAAPASVLPR